MYDKTIRLAQDCNTYVVMMMMMMMMILILQEDVSRNCSLVSVPA